MAANLLITSWASGALGLNATFSKEASREANKRAGAAAAPHLPLRSNRKVKRRFFDLAPASTEPSSHPRQCVIRPSSI